MSFSRTKSLLALFLMSLTLAACPGGGPKEIDNQPPGGGSGSGGGGGDKGGGGGLPPAPRKIVPVFGFRKPNPPPLKPEPFRAPKVAGSVAPMTTDYPALNKSIQACTTHYENEWKNSQKILGHLKSLPHSCWTDDQKREIQGLETEFVADLATLQAQIAALKSPIEPATAKANYELLKTVTQTYAMLQEQLSYCRVSTFMKQDPPVAPKREDNYPIKTEEDNLLLNMLGDVFGLDSGFEGGPPVLNLQYRLQVLKKISNTFEKKVYIASQRQADPCFDVGHIYKIQEDEVTPPLPDFNSKLIALLVKKTEIAIRLSTAFSGRLEDFIKELSRTLEKDIPSVNDSFYFAAGSNEHTVAYEIVREVGNRFTFRVFNTGDGNDFQASLTNGVRLLSFPFVERANISHPNILNPVVWKAAQDLKVLSSVSITGKRQMSYLYSYILQEFNGVKTTPTTNVEAFLDPQLAGTCSYSIFPFYNKSTLENRNEASNLEFYIQAKYLDFYNRLNALRFEQVEPALKLAKKATTFFSEMLAKNLDPKQAYLDRGMIRLGYENLLVYKDIFDNALEKSLAAVKTDTYEADIHRLEDALPPSYTDIHTSIYVKSGTAGSLSYKTTSIEKWTPTQGNLSKDIDGFIADFKNKAALTPEQREIEYPKVRFSIREISRKLPLDEKFWNHYTLAELEGILSQLRLLGQHYLWSVMLAGQYDWAENRGFSTLDVLTQVKLLTTANVILEIYKKNNPLFEDFSSLYLPIFNHYIVGNQKDRWSSIISGKDKNWVGPFLEMSKYWGQRTVSESFFGFEKFPLYAGDQNRYLCLKASDCYFDHWSIPYGMPNQIGWPDIRWSLNKLKNKQIPRKPQYHTELEQSLAELDQSRSTLPQAFFDLRKISFITHFFNFGYFNRDFNSAFVRTYTTYYSSDTPFLHSSTWPINLSYYSNRRMGKDNVTVERQETYYSNYLNILDAYISFPEENKKKLLNSAGRGYVEDPTKNLELGEEKAKLEEFKDLIHTHQHYYTEKNPASIPYLKKLNSAAIVASDQSASPKLTLELSRQILNMGSIPVTLAFFSEHPYYLREKKWQILFKSFMFQPGLLTQEHLKTTHLAELLAEFCSKNFKLRFKDQDYETAAFFLRMNQLFFEFSQDILSQSKNHKIAGTRLPYMNTREKYSEILAQLPADHTENARLKNLIYRDVIRTYLHEDIFNSDKKERIPEKDLSLYIIAKAYRAKYPLSKAEDYEVDEETSIEGIHALKLHSISEYLERIDNKTRDAILSDILRFYVPSEKVRVWSRSGAEPLFWESKSGSGYPVGIDLVRPKVYVGGKDLVSLPMHILQSEIFKKHVDHDPREEAIELGNGFYEIAEKSGRRVRIGIGQSGKFVLQRKWVDTWYELLNDYEILDKAINDKDWFFTPGYDNWISVLDNFVSHKINNTNLAPPYTGWKSPVGGGGGHDQEVLAYDKSTKKLYSVAKKVGDIPLVKKVDDKGHLLPLVLHHVTDKDSTLHFLTRFELPRYIWVWKDQKTKKIDHVDLPRFGLTFESNANGRLACKEQGFYILSEIQNFQGWEKYPHYLVLELDGKKKLLFPRYEFKGLSTGLLSQTYQTEFKSEAMEKKSQRYFSYLVDSFSGAIIPPTLESRFFLAHLYLWGHKYEEDSYEKARDHLYGTRSELGSYTPEEAEVLHWIQSGENRDHDPRAIALRLGAFGLEGKNSILNHKAPPKDWTKEYDQFLMVQDRIDPKWFPADLEVTLLQSGSALSPRSQNRLAELTGQKVGAVRLTDGESNSVVFNFSFSELYSIGGYFSPISNLFRSAGIGHDFKDHYTIALNFMHGVAKDQLVSLLSRVTTISEAELNLKSLDQLKAEYLSFIRMVARSGESSDSGLANLIYKIALNRNSLATLPSYKDLMDDMALWRSGDKKCQNLMHKFYSLQYDGINVPQDLSGDTVVLKTPSSPGKESFFWDGKQNPAFQPKMQITYQLEDSLKEYDLLKKPILTEDVISRYIKEEALSAAEKTKIDQISNDLHQVFNKKVINGDQFVNKNLEQIVAAIQQKRESSIKNRKSYRLVDLPGLIKLKDNQLIPLQKKTFDQSKDLERKILQTAKKLPEHFWSKMERVTRLEGAIDHNPKIETLLHHYANRSMHGLFHENPTLKADDVNQMIQDITSYLIISTYYFKLSTVITELESLVKSYADPKRSEASKEEEVRSFFTRATQLRGYQLDEYPECLVFEYFMRVIIRKDQINSLVELDITKRQEKNPNAKGVILEMIMGSGKTFVLLPLLSHLNAKPNQLSIIILPESLLPSMVEQVNTQLSKTFGQAVDTLHIRRSDKYDVPKLEVLYKRLKDDLLSQRVVVTSNSSIQSLFLIFVEKLYDYHSLDAELRAKEISLLQDIFWLFRNYGYVTIDEIDMILDIMSSHRFSLGTSKKIEKEIVDPVVGLYSLFALDPKIQEVVKLSFLNAAGPHAKPFSKELYQNQIFNAIVQKITENASAEYFFEDKGLIEQYKTLDKADIVKYFRSTDSVEMDKYIESLPNAHFKNLFTVVYTELHQILPLTISKLHRVHYGIYPKEECEGQPNCPEFIAIPYHSGMPIPTSRFGSDLESLNYTIQTHLELRDTFIFLQKEYENLSRKYRKNDTKQIRDRIEEYFGKMSKGTFLNLSEHDIQRRALIVNQNPLLINKLVKSYAIEQIKVFPNQLQTNSHIYPILFRSIQGVTGTLWNKDSFPDFYEKVIPSDTLAHTLMLLWKNKDAHQVKVLDTRFGETLDETINHLLNGQGAVSVIDQGGIFRGIDNELVARKLIHHDAYRRMGLINIIFYDAQNKLMIYNIIENSVKPYSPAITDRNKTIAFWDMQHTTGSDLKVHPQMRAILTINKFTTIRDILQSAWRLRELEINQNVIFMIPRDDLSVMSKTLSEYFGPAAALDTKAVNVNLEPVLLYLATNEAIISGNLNFRSVKGSQRGVVIDSIFDLLIDKSEKTKLSDAFKAVKAFFDSPREKHPYERFGMPVEKASPLKYLKENILKLFTPRAVFFGNKDEILEKFDTVLDNSKHKLPKEVVVPVREELETGAEMEVELELATEVETEVETEQEVQLHHVDKNFKKRRVVWDKDRFFRGDYFAGLQTRASLAKPILDHAFRLMSPVTTIEDVLFVGGKKQYSSKFDHALWASLNLFPVFMEDKKGGESKFEPFGVHQGEINEGMLVLDKSGNPMSFILLERDEAFEIGAWLIEEVESNSNLLTNNYRVLIYEFGNGFIRYSKNVKDAVGADRLRTYFKQLQKDKRFLALLVQTKFLSGRLSYKKSELSILKDWLKHNNQAPDLYKLFKEEILLFKDTTQEEFKESQIQHLFQDLGVVAK